MESDIGKWITERLSVNLKEFNDFISIKIDTSKSRFEILDESELTLNEVVQQDKTDMKNLLKKKWKEVNNKDD